MWVRWCPPRGGLLGCGLAPAGWHPLAATVPAATGLALAKAAAGFALGSYALACSGLATLALARGGLGGQCCGGELAEDLRRCAGCAKGSGARGPPVLGPTELRDALNRAERGVELNGPGGFLPTTGLALKHGQVSEDLMPSSSEEEEDDDDDDDDECDVGSDDTGSEDAGSEQNLAGSEEGKKRKVVVAKHAGYSDQESGDEDEDEDEDDEHPAALTNVKKMVFSPTAADQPRPQAGPEHRGEGASAAQAEAKRRASLAVLGAAPAGKPPPAHAPSRRFSLASLGVNLGAGNLFGAGAGPSSGAKALAERRAAEESARAFEVAFAVNLGEWELADFGPEAQGFFVEALGSGGLKALLHATPPGAVGAAASVRVARAREEAGGLGVVAEVVCGPLWPKAAADALSASVEPGSVDLGALLAALDDNGFGSCTFAPPVTTVVGGESFDPHPAVKRPAQSPAKSPVRRKSSSPPSQRQKEKGEGDCNEGDSDEGQAPLPSPPRRQSLASPGSSRDPSGGRGGGGRGGGGRGGGRGGRGNGRSAAVTEGGGRSGRSGRGGRGGRGGKAPLASPGPSATLGGGSDSDRGSDSDDDDDDTGGARRWSVVRSQLGHVLSSGPRGITMQALSAGAAATPGAVAAPGQLWRLEPNGELRCKAGGLLEVEGFGAGAPGTSLAKLRKAPVCLAAGLAGAAPGQRWSRTSPLLELQSGLGGGALVLTVRGGSTAVGAGLWVNARNGTKAQAWTFELV